MSMNEGVEAEYKAAIAALKAELAVARTGYLKTCPWCHTDLREGSNVMQTKHLVDCGDALKARLARVEGAVRVLSAAVLDKAARLLRASYFEDDCVEAHREACKQIAVWLRDDADAFRAALADAPAPANEEQRRHHGACECCWEAAVNRAFHTGTSATEEYPTVLKLHEERGCECAKPAPDAQGGEK